MKITKEAAIAALWTRGELSWKLRPEQRALKVELERPEKQLVVGNISRRWGKTYTLAVYSLEQALRSKTKIRFGCAFATDLEEFVVPAFAQLLEDAPDHLRPTYIRSRKTYTFANGSEIKLVGLDKNPNGLRGNAIGIIVVDEAGYVSNLKHVYESVIVPATAKQARIKVVFISTPPESPDHHFSSVLIPKAQTKENAYYLCLTIDDISDLLPAERKRLLDEVGGEFCSTAQREFFCRLLVDETRSICPQFSDRHIASVTVDHVKWGLFGDAGGVRDKTAILEVGWDHSTQRVLFRDELIFNSGTPTAKIAQAIKFKFPGRTLVLDASGQTLVDLSSLGLAALPPQKDDFSAGLLLLASAFHNDQVSIDPRCQLLIQTLANGLLNRQRSDYERSDALGHCDSVAAAIYGLRGVDRLTDLKPKPRSEDVFTRQVDPPHIKGLKGLSYAR